ncbi:MAG: hypothetical protein OXK21_00820 [Chloroflexota bacterium]|nr:hypothetical protein [Chloroflexota bacterium]
MDIQKLLVQAAIFSIVISIGWVAFWTVIVPALFGGRTWAGHESWLIPGAIAGLLGILLASTSSKR